VETKAFSVFGNGRAQINSEGALLLSKKVAFGDPLVQTRKSADKVSRHLESVLRRELLVDAVLVFPGWEVGNPKAETGVVVLNEGMISEFFTSRERVLSNQEIRDICSHLDRSARS